jgi:hypothetical protein
MRDLLGFLGFKRRRKEAKIKMSEVGFEPTPSHEDQNLSLAP